jgi:hypothetical protein
MRGRLQASSCSNAAVWREMGRNSPDLADTAALPLTSTDSFFAVSI